MTDKEIFEKLQKIISSKMGALAPIESIKTDTNLISETGMDSLDVLTLFYTITKEFNLSTNTAEEDSFIEIFNQNPTVQTIVNIISKKLTESSQPSRDISGHRTTESNTPQTQETHKQPKPIAQPAQEPVIEQTVQHMQNIEQKQEQETVIEPVSAEPSDNCALKKLFNRIKQRFGKIVNNKQEQNTK